MKRQKYTHERLHALNYMNAYRATIEADVASDERKKELIQRLVTVRETAYNMFCDAYRIIQKMDGEQTHDLDVVWNDSLRAMRYAEPHYTEYTREALHCMRHFEEHLAEIEAGVTLERKIYLKESFGKVKKMSVHAYYDAERLLVKLS